MAAAVPEKRDEGSDEDHYDMPVFVEHDDPISASKLSSLNYWDSDLVKQPTLSDFVCPLTGRTMEDPVRAADGFCYERSAIVRWFEERSVNDKEATSPSDPLKVITKKLVQNDKLRIAINQYWAAATSSDEESLSSSGTLSGSHMSSASEGSAPAADETVAFCFWPPQGMQPEGSERSAKLKSAGAHRQQRRGSRDGSHGRHSQSGGGHGHHSQSHDGHDDFATSLSKFFAEFDKTRDLLERVLKDWQPPKFVAAGKESAGKSTFLEQLLMMPLFPRDITFCTRMAIQVHLRRTVDASCPTVIMGVREAPHLGGKRCGETFTIPVANGYQFVQEKMDELVRDAASHSVEGIVSDHVLVLEVHHPHVPSVDLVDMPGHATVPQAKVDAIERTLELHLEHDKATQGHSMYLAVVPASETPNTSDVMKFIEKHGLGEKSMGVFTKCDKVHKSDVPTLGTLVTGKDLKHGGKTASAESLGEVKLGLGWKTTMLAPPDAPPGCPDNYFKVHNTERLAVQKQREAAFFQDEVWRRELPAEAMGISAVVRALEKAYSEYLNTTWRHQAMNKVLVKFQRTDQDRLLLGNCDEPHFDKQALAVAEVVRRFTPVLPRLSTMFCERLESGFRARVAVELQEGVGKEWAASDIAPTLSKLKESVLAEAAATVEDMKAHWRKSLRGVLETQVTREKDDSGEWSYVASFACISGSMKARVPFVAPKASTLYKQVKNKGFIQIAQYPTFVESFVSKLDKYLEGKARDILSDQSKLTDRLVDVDSPWLTLTPSRGCESVGVTLQVERFVNASTVCFMKHLPTQSELGALSEGVGLGEEAASAREERSELEKECQLVLSARDSVVRMLSVQPHELKAYEDAAEWDE